MLRMAIGGRFRALFSFSGPFDLHFLWNDIRLSSQTGENPATTPSQRTPTKGKASFAPLPPATAASCEPSSPAAAQADFQVFFSQLKSGDGFRGAPAVDIAQHDHDAVMLTSG